MLQTTILHVQAVPADSKPFHLVFLNAVVLLETWWASGRMHRLVSCYGVKGAGSSVLSSLGLIACHAVFTLSNPAH